MCPYNFEYLVRAHSDNSNICIVDGGVRKRSAFRPTQISPTAKCAKKRIPPYANVSDGGVRKRSAFRPTRTVFHATSSVVRRFGLHSPGLMGGRTHALLNRLEDIAV